jgi:TrpR family trp operon transcriptional repressor
MAKISKEQSEKYTEELITVLQKHSNNKDLLRAFFKDLLTPTEYKDIGIRWQIIKRLVKRGTHRQIARDLKIGVATVARGSRELNDKNGGFWQMVKKLGKSL